MQVALDADQLSDQPVTSHVSNLFAPVPGDRGARGDFDDRSKGGALRVSGLTAQLGILLGLGALVTLWRARSR